MIAENLFGGLNKNLKVQVVDVIESVEASISEATVIVDSAVEVMITVTGGTYISLSIIVEGKHIVESDIEAKSNYRYVFKHT